MDFWKKLYTAGCWVLSLALPVKRDRVVFCSYYGRGYSDSPKAIAQALLEEKDFRGELIWLVKDQKEADTLPPGITPCPYDSPKRIWALATAGIWVDNCRKYDRFKKKGQYYLQTWHGFALKKIEKDALESLAPDFEKGAIKDSAHTDILLSGSRFMTEVLRRAYWYEGNIASWGTPRNDVFFKPQRETRGKVLAHFQLPGDRQLMLYAPTYRADHGVDAYRLEAERVIRACEARFGGQWSLLVRLHPNVAEASVGLFPYDGDWVLDATMYPDMQELLQAADGLITDYSSCIVDFALSRKPCFQFAMDLDSYRDDRGFYFSLDTLPFPLARSNEALEAEILDYDTEKAREDWEAFSLLQGFCEDGEASRRCVQWIMEHTT